MNCPPPSHSIWCFFCCVRAFSWIDYRIIELIAHLSFSKRVVFMMGILKKMVHSSFSSFCCVGTRKKKYIFFKKEEQQKEVVIGI